MRVLGKITYSVFLALLLAVAGLLLVSLMPMAGNFEIKIVKSGSMEPAIQTGSIVVVIPAASYSVGDVVTFGKDTSREIPTTHRIVSERVSPSAGGGQIFFTTKGDANEEADPKEVAARDVIGKVLFHVPYAGFVLDFARQPVGFSLLIGLPAMMIVIDESVNIVKEIAAMRRRKKKGAPALLNLEVPKKPDMFRGRIPTI